MATEAKNIIPRKSVENSQTIQYTATVGKTIIDKFTVTNVSGVPVTFSCNLVIAAGSTADDNLMIKNKTIAAGKPYLCPELVGQILETGGFISTLAGAAIALTISASGREIT